MKLSDLTFDYPQHLIALEKEQQSRVLVAELKSKSEAQLKELGSVSDLLSFFHPDDILVLNNTRVLPRRIFTENNFEILFLHQLEAGDQGEMWSVLCPSSQWPKETELSLPDGVLAQLVEKGRPQTVKVRRLQGGSKILTEEYFAKNGDLPLPPYILKARKEKRTRHKDGENYQTQWAKIPGSLAAPTASLHFSKEHISQIRARGVNVLEMTLHVGLGTFLPITTSLDDHKMHSEFVSLAKNVWQEVEQAKARGSKVWALGTTVARSLESIAAKKITANSNGDYVGETDIFIRPGFEFQIVDCLLTNFHQPESTLLALVAAFANDLELVKKVYAYAIEKQFRLFSYGDLSAWIK
jgi:S-adenosylmethionine:tRNA ribosyltransferase-isomerase